MVIWMKCWFPGSLTAAIRQFLQHRCRVMLGSVDHAGCFRYSNDPARYGIRSHRRSDTRHSDHRSGTRSKHGRDAVPSHRLCHISGRPRMSSTNGRPNSLASTTSIGRRPSSIMCGWNIHRARLAHRPHTSLANAQTDAAWRRARSPPVSVAAHAARDGAPRSRAARGGTRNWHHRAPPRGQCGRSAESGSPFSTSLIRPSDDPARGMFAQSREVREPRERHRPDIDRSGFNRYPVWSHLGTTASTPLDPASRRLSIRRITPAAPPPTPPDPSNRSTAAVAHSEEVHTARSPHQEPKAPPQCGPVENVGSTVLGHPVFGQPHPTGPVSIQIGILPIIRPTRRSTSSTASTRSCLCRFLRRAVCLNRR